MRVAAGRAGDEAAASDLSANQAFGFQQFIGCGNRGTVQAKQASQFTSGWQPGSGGELAAVDRVLQLLKNLAVKRDVGLSVDVGGRKHLLRSIPYWTGTGNPIPETHTLSQHFIAW